MGWTCQGFAGAAPLRQALMRAPTSAEALALLDQALGQNLGPTLADQ
jgi:hypothetical protein